MSTETLEFPAIEEPRTELATTEPGAVDLAKIDLQAVALAQFNSAHADAKKAAETLTGVVHDLSTSTKLAEAKSLRNRLINVPLADARKVSSGLKSKLTAVSRAVGAELEAIEKEFEKAATLITPQIEAREAEIAEEKRIAAEQEAARVEAHMANLAKLAEPAERCRQPGMTTERIDMKPLVIYHANCTDGFTAAWCFHHAAPDTFDFLPASYGQEPPDVTGRQVYLVDFSYPRDQLLAMAEKAAGVTVLDHHQSAEAALADLTHPRLFIHFDMQRSGAGMAWDFLFPQLPRPRFLGFVEDRDLWRFSFAETKASHAYLNSVHHNFEAWDEIMLGGALKQTSMLAQGEALVRMLGNQVLEAVRSTLRTVEIGGHVVPVANVPGFLASDAGHSMNEGVPFAATYFDTEKRRCFSLRSRPDGADVSLIAGQYGGGGHKHAAGFSVLRDHELARA